MNMCERYKIDSDKINDYYEAITIINQQKILSEIYEYIKNITQYYFENSQIKKEYKYIIKDLLRIEKNVFKTKILNPTIKINQTPNNFIEYVVSETRAYLLKEIKHTENIETFQNLNLSNKCQKASNYVQRLCQKNKIESYILPIYPGYDEKALLYNGNGYHFANIIKYNNAYYLIDTTYSQFFYTVRNNIDRLGILKTGGCNLGIFMLMDEFRYKLATQLIKDGYIELTEEIFKIYLDAFTISYRNGLFYEQTNDFTYTTEYKIEDYIKFLKCENSQIENEGRLCLGIQNQPLKNPQLIFKKK